MLPVTYFKGLQAICVKPPTGGTFRHVWAESQVFASDAGREFLAAFQPVNDQGENVYFSIAAFDPAGTYTEFAGRRQAQASACSVLVGDLDYRKHSQDGAWARGLLDAFCGMHALPTPTAVVDTGGGLHIYWHLDAALPNDTWLPLARRLSAVFQQVNAAIGERVIDTQCTVDIARVLRVPGFRNHKYPDAPLVQVLRVGDALVPVAAMQTALVGYDAGPAVAAVPSAISSIVAVAGFQAPVASTPAGLRSAFADAVVSEPASWAQLRDKSLVGRGCEVLRRVLADNNAAGYEVWSGLLSVIQFTDGGDDALKAVSAGHKDYGTAVSLRDCRTKAATFHSPRTCANFAEVMPEACAGCPNAGKIKSPIMLGRGGDRIEIQPTPADVAAAMVALPDTLPPPPVNEHALVPPSPECDRTWAPVDKMFRYREKTGEVEMRQDTDTPGVVAYGVILNRPMWLVNMVDDRVRLGVLDHNLREHTRDFDSTKLLGGGDWGPLVAWLTPRGVHPMFTVTKSNPSQHPLVMFIKSLIHRYGAERALTEVEHFGPSREVRPQDFVLGNLRYTTDGQPPSEVQIAEGSPLVEHVGGMLALPANESMAAAVEFSNRLLPVYEGPDWGCDRFIIMAALSACLSPFIVPREMQGGVIVVPSPGSGEAKSSTLLTGASLYSRTPGTIKRANATHTAVFKTLLPRLNAVPLMLDDWDKQIRGSQASDVAGALTDLIVQSTNLRPKALANGEVTPGWWSTYLFLATNSDVADMVSRTETGGAAAGMRFLEVPIPSRQHISVARQNAYETFRQWREEHGGQTAHSLLRNVLPHIGSLAERYAYWNDHLRGHSPAMAQMSARFLRAMVACTLAGGEAASYFKLLPFDVNEAFELGCRLITRQVQQTEAQVTEADSIVHAYLAANVQRIVNLTSTSRMITSGAAEVAAAVNANDQVMIPTAALTEWLRRTNRSTSHVLARLRRTYGEVDIATCQIPAAGLTLSLKCYVVKLPGVTAKVELAQLTTVATPTSAGMPLH